MEFELGVLKLPILKFWSFEVADLEFFTLWSQGEKMTFIRIELWLADFHLAVFENPRAEL